MLSCHARGLRAALTFQHACVRACRRVQERLLKKAEAEKDGKASESKKPIVVKFGINHVTYLVEQARAATGA